MIRDGEASHLLVWKLDRWSRQGIAALGDLVDTLDARPDATFIALRDGLRSDMAAWRIIAAVLAEVARIEAENTSTRVKSSQAHLLKVGRFRGFVPPFGYRSAPNPDGPGRILVQDPVEAAIVRELTASLLSGASMTELTVRLQREGVPTTKSPARKARQHHLPTEGLDSGLWHLTVLRGILRSDTLLGRTTHEVNGRRVPVTDDDGVPITFWEPIIEPATLALLRERLPVDSGKLARRTRAARVLSGVAFCAVCDSKLYVVRSGAHVFYRCAAKKPDLVPPCPCPQLRADALEKFVEERLLRLIGAQPEVEEVRVVENPEAAADLADIDRALHDATAALMSDGVDASAVMGRIEALKARRAALREQPAAVHTTLVPTGRTLADAWHAADPATPEGVRARRTLLLREVDHLTLAPGSSRADPVAERVTVLLSREDEYAALSAFEVAG